MGFLIKIYIYIKYKGTKNVTLINSNYEREVNLNFVIELHIM